MVKVLGNRLREVAGNAETRDGSFFGARGFVQVTVVVSGLVYVEAIKNYYDRAVKSARTPKAGEEAEGKAERKTKKTAKKKAD